MVEDDAGMETVAGQGEVRRERRGPRWIIWKELKTRKKTRAACATTRAAEIRVVAHKPWVHIDRAKLATAAEEEDEGIYIVKEGIG